MKYLSLAIFKNWGGYERYFNFLTALTAFFFVVSSSLVVASCSGDDPSGVLPDATVNPADTTATDTTAAQPSFNININDEWDGQTDITY